MAADTSVVIDGAGEAETPSETQSGSSNNGGKSPTPSSSSVDVTPDTSSEVSGCLQVKSVDLF